MGRKKLSPLVQAMNLFGQMDERDKQTLADWIRSQTATPRKVSTKKSSKRVTLLPDNPDDFQQGSVSL